HVPPSTWASTSAVPSPPSATGSSSASAPASRSPDASAAAASRGIRTPLRLAGDASASRWALLGLLDVGGLLRRSLLHALQRRVRHPLACQEDESDADSDRRLDGLQPDAESDAVRVRDAVADERDRNGDLHKAEVPGPEREDRRDVHQHEDEAGRREWKVDAERPHRGPDGEQLTEPAGELERPRLRRRDRRPHDGEPVACTREQPPDAPVLLALPLLPAGEEHGGEEQDAADDEEDADRRERPLRDLRRREDPDHEG